MSSESPKRTTVALPVSRLQAHGPRGVVCVARAVAERLVSDPSLDLLAISDPIFHFGEMLFRSWDLTQWLADHPIVIAQPRCPAVEQPVGANHARPERAAVLKRLLTSLGLRRPAKLAFKAVRPAVSATQRALKKITDLGLRRPARRASRVIRSGSVPPEARVDLTLVRTRREQSPYPECPSQCVEQASRFVSMRDLDALISFECDDAIWDWPTELYDCKLIGFFHGAIPLRLNQGPGQDPGSFYRSCAKMVQRADRIVCGSKSAESDLHTFYPHSGPKTRVLHLGHDLERFAMDDDTAAPRACDGATPSRSRRGPARAKDTRKVAIFGDLEPRKNRSGVLRACRHIAALRPSERITLVLIGRSPDPEPDLNPYRWLEHEAERYVDLQYLGHVADDRIGDVLRSCDVFIYPSLWEGFGTPVLEAMTAGVPVVCAENSSLTEVGGAHVFYGDPYDPASIASAVSRALSLSDEERERWVADARRWARQFTWASTTEHLVELIRERVAQAPPATSWRPPLAALPLVQAA